MVKQDQGPQPSPLMSSVGRPVVNPHSNPIHKAGLSYPFADENYRGSDCMPCLRVAAQVSVRTATQHS